MPLATEPRTLRVLVVDDIPLMRTMLTKYVTTLGRNSLRSLGQEVQVDVLEANNGADALALLEREKADLIFLDLMMPEMDGLTFLIHRREKPELRDIPVVVCSASTEEDSASHARSLGANDFMSKPFTLRSIETTLRSALESHS